VLLNEVPLVRVVLQVDRNTHTEDLKILLDSVWGKPLSATRQRGHSSDLT